jgi:hypothetical protein
LKQFQRLHFINLSDLWFERWALILALTFEFGTLTARQFIQQDDFVGKTGSQHIMRVIA